MMNTGIFASSYARGGNARGLSPIPFSGTEGCARCLRLPLLCWYERHPSGVRHRLNKKEPRQLPRLEVGASVRISHTRLFSQPYRLVVPLDEPPAPEPVVVGC
jgi:hypothetical protein